MSDLLVTDDEPDMRFLVRMALRGRGWDVDEAASGQEALDRCREGSYDVVVLDQRMPGLTGAETARQLIDDGFDVPIVVFSAYLTTAMEADFREMGITALPKDDLPGLINLIESLR